MADEKEDKSEKSWNIVKWLKSVSGTEIAENVDKVEREYIRAQKAKPKDRFTSNERSKLIANLKNNNNRPATSSISTDEYIRKLFNDSASTALDNARLRTMTPEISQASAFMVSAIISPNDLRQGEISIKVDETSLTEAQRDNIESLLKELFEERFKLSINLPKWIDEALYNSGAKCLLTVPMSTLEQELLGEGSSSNISKESFDKLDLKFSDKTSLFGISSEVGKTDIDELSSSTINIATEGFHQIKYNGSKAIKPIPPIKEKWNRFVKSMVSTEAIKLTDNPFKLRVDKMRNKIAKDQLKRTSSQYTAYKPAKGKAEDGTKPFVQLSHTKNDHIGEPLFAEIPTESVIPVFVPGTPTEALGYLLVVDQNGHFASLSGAGDVISGPGKNSSNDRYNFDQLYAAAGFNSNMGGTRSSEAESVMAKIHQAVIQDYLEGKVESAGFKNVSLGSNPTVYKYMFNQYLCNRQTNLLWVPADMLTYFAFEHGPDGRGVSDLERAKYILSLRNTLQTCKIISALNASIDRKKLTINSEDGNNSGYALQEIQNLIDTHIRKNRWAVSADPQQTANQLVEKAYSVNIKGVPGLNYEIEDVVNSKESAPIDDGLSEELYKQLIMSLFIPAAAMNALGADEYSRSVVTSNLFTSNLIMVRQRVVMSHTNDFLQRYSRYSPIVRKGILEIINKREETKPQNESGNINLDKPTDDDLERLDNIIESISISLPPPNIAPNKAMWEVINDTAQGADTLVNTLYPDELAGENNPVLVDALKTARSWIKRTYVSNSVAANGLDSEDLIDIEQLHDVDLTMFRQRLTNLAKAFNRQGKVMDNKEDVEDAQNNGGGDSMGGMGGMDGGADSFGGDMGGGDMGGF